MTVLLVAGFALTLCLVAATLVTNVALRDALGTTYAVGTYFIIAPAFVGVCVVAIAVRIWRHIRGRP